MSGENTLVYKKHGGSEQVFLSGSTLRVQGRKYESQPSPTAKTVAVTLTIAELLTRIITAVPTATGATAAYTLPTGALIDAGVTMEVDDSFDWTIINSALAAADTITITAATGHTIVGGPIVQSLHATTGGITGYSATYRTRKTAADTFVSYRIA
jgi:hypothetical protein